jgi:cell division control protein 6
LNCQTLQFNSYNAPQLQEILSKRVEQAFKPGTVPDEVLEEIAETVAENSRDCREALEMLLRAGRKTDQSSKSELEISML